jgi:hypothetical protein
MFMLPAASGTKRGNIFHIFQNHPARPYFILGVAMQPPSLVVQPPAQIRFFAIHDSLSRLCPLPQHKPQGCQIAFTKYLSIKKIQQCHAP